jgi:hypothetical protein
MLDIDSYKYQGSEPKIMILTDDLLPVVHQICVLTVSFFLGIDGAELFQVARSHAHPQLEGP